MLKWTGGDLNRVGFKPHLSTTLFRNQTTIVSRILFKMRVRWDLTPKGGGTISLKIADSEENAEKQPANASAHRTESDRLTQMGMGPYAQTC